MLSKIKLLIGITDYSQDELLTILIETAILEVRNYTHNDCIAEVENTICDMVVIKYNRLKTEGVAQESYSGVSFTYSTDYPDSIMRSLRSHRKVQTI